MKLRRKKIVCILLFFAIVFSSCREKLNPLIYSNSDNIDFPSQSVTIDILSPRAGDRFVLGRSITIRWQISGAVKTLGIQLFRKDTLISTLSLSVINDGIFTWSIPVSLPVSNNYKIKITDQEDINSFTYSDMFSIVESN